MSILVSIEIIEFFEDISSQPLDTLFKGITDIFSPPMLMVFFTILFWLWDKKRWANALIFMIFVNFSVIIFKGLFQLSRPPQRFHRIEMEGYGFPSGHATSISGAAGWFIYLKRSWIAITFGAVITLSVTISRVYLGVHYPRDVLGGILLGAIMIFSGILIVRRMEKKILKMNNAYKITLVLAITLAMVVYSARVKYDCINGLRLSGFFLGFCIGRIVFVDRYENSSFEIPLQKGDLKRGGLRVLIGMLLVIGPLGVGTVIMGAGLAPLTTYFVAFLIFCTAGSFVSFIAPITFCKIEKNYCPPISQR